MMRSSSQDYQLQYLLALALEVVGAGWFCWTAMVNYEGFMINIPVRSLWGGMMRQESNWVRGAG
jgi:hypothetical protein